MFGNLKIQDGPASLEDGEPGFPREKREEYASRRDQQQRQKNELKSSTAATSDILNCKQHCWVPHFGAGPQFGPDLKVRL